MLHNYPESKAFSAIRESRATIQAKQPDGADEGVFSGLDGVKNKLDPGSAIDKDLYDLPPAELKRIPTVCGSLRQALGELDKGREFLKAGGVFDDDFIDSYIDLKMQEVIRFEHTPHPVEFDMYYSA